MRRRAAVAAALALLGGVVVCQPAAAQGILGDRLWKKSIVAGATAHQQGNFAEAEKHFKAALAKAERFPADDPRLFNSLLNLSVVLRPQRKYAASERVLKRALAIAERSLGLDHPNVASTLEHYVALLGDMGRKAEAARVTARIKAIRAKPPGPPAAKKSGAHSSKK